MTRPTEMTQRATFALRGRATVIAALVLTICTVATLPTSPAEAAGTPSLDRYIIGAPLAGWVSFPSSHLDEVASGLQQMETNETARLGLRSQVAAEGWHDPSSAQNGLLVVLVRLYAPQLTGPSILAQMGAAASAASSTFCVGATGQPSISDQPFPGLSGSHLTSCQATPNGTVPDALSWSKGNILALFVFTNRFPSNQIGALAQQQDARLPNGVATVAANPSPSNWPVVVGIAGGAVIAAAMFTFGIVIGRRRRRVVIAASVGAFGTPEGGWDQAQPASRQMVGPPAAEEDEGAPSPFSSG